ncbi:L-2-hydroxyglutarate oxidase [Cellulomonas soli]|uniref:Hydroxyglutarate oxidase n=1 Tax=Cellulomonas soli TaxID=931535 RepID=A0A512PG11_9CELL|nr:L-2-hydroxyglutarate oxidase [Cellulomonas soli]NYI59719.1 L-2-hydroxyglutarate oxidase [Cellulomonas soli]GEP70138.1 hydroxyglutarate oxidase [Cellulomonas soli]
MARVVVVGAGIVGLAVAARLADDGHEVTVLEKEPAVARHQTGRNSGVIHSGLYYAPGSLKARMATAGAASMKAYAQRRGVPVRTCGKLVVASDDTQLPGLHRLAERALANDVEAALLTPEQAREHEPHIASVGALWVTQTGVVDYPGVCAALAEDVVAHGGGLLTDTQVVSAAERTDGLHVQVRTGGREHELTADLLVACAGLQADRVARACGIEPAARIVPFRGEYATVREPAASLVRGLVYPVPDPRFPFLGVHLTRGVDGHVHAGPNAVLALAREGYTWGQISPRDVLDTFSWPGLWRMGVHHLGSGASEVARSASRQLFARSVARFLPELRTEDLVPAPAGVRAQALARDGKLVDDFLVQRSGRQVHVLNAPSPAATAALEIAAHVVDELPQP